MEDLSTDKKELLRAKTIVFRLLKVRPRSEGEIRTRLKLKKIAEGTIENTVTYFKHIDLINDRQFAKAWTQARLLKPFGLNRIRFELKNKGINDTLLKETISEAAKTFPEVHTIARLVQKRLPKYKSADPLKTKRQLFGYLVRRGFKPGDVTSALSKINKRSSDYDS